MFSHVATVDTGITQSTPSSVTNGVAKVWLSGGLHGKTYKVTVTLTTVGGRIKQVEILIKVKET